MVWENIVKVEYDVRKEMAEVHDVRFLHTRESVHPAKCGRVVYLQEEDPYVKIG